MNENTGSSRKRKTLSATMAVVMAAIMLLSGTLAYFYSSMAINTFSAGRKAVVGHDDFEEGVNKDIYVENVGDTDVYVRVKLTEDLKLTDATQVTSEKGSPETPLVHGVNSITDVNLGNQSEQNHKDIHHYFTWTMGNITQQQVLSATDKLFEVTNDNGNGVYLDADQVAHDNYGEGVATGEEIRYAPACDVITMDEYKSYGYDESVDGKPAQTDFRGWVCDTDGWYYWSQKLPAKKNTVTGLLLNNVAVNGLEEYEYLYHINVEFQAVDDEDIGIWTEKQVIDSNKVNVGLQEQASDDAKRLLEIAGAAAIGEKPLRVQLDELITEAETVGSEGAKKLFESAKGKLNGTNTEEMLSAEELMIAGQDALDNFSANQAKGNLVELNADSTVKSTSVIKDSGLARSLVENYGNKTDGTLTYDQALAVERIPINKYAVDSLSELSATTFPNLWSIDVYSQDGLASKNMLESIPSTAGNNVKEKIRIIGMQRQSAPTGTLDLREFTKLVYINFNNCVNITAVDFPSSIKGASFRSVGIQSVNFESCPNMEFVAIGGSSLKEIKGLNELNNLQFLQISGGTAADRRTTLNEESRTIELSAAKDLNCLDIEDTNIKQIICHKDAFSAGKSFRVMEDFLLLNPSFSVKEKSAALIDISRFENWTIDSVVLSQSGDAYLPPAIVIRRADQPKFSGYTKQDVYEKVIGGGKDGKDLFVWHKADGTADETLLESEFNMKYDEAIAAGGLQVKTVA